MMMIYQMMRVLLTIDTDMQVNISLSVYPIERVLCSLLLLLLLLLKICYCFCFRCSREILKKKKKKKKKKKAGGGGCG